MTTTRVVKVRTDEDIAATGTLVWAFFDFLRTRYPDMQDEIDAYIARQDVAGQLAAFSDHFMPPSGQAFLALHDGKPVGTVMLRPRGPVSGEMNRMFVRDTARGLGLGRALCAALMDEARALGYRRLYLDALYRHTEALPLYESMGFVRYRASGAPDGDDSRVIHMRLSL